MPKQFVDRDKHGEVSKSMPDVIVEFLGIRPLTWTCQNYVGDGRDMMFNFIPGEKETLEYNYAKSVFGDWEIDPSASSVKKREWRTMMAQTAQRSPSFDGKLPRARIYDQAGNLLWDTIKQFSDYLADIAQSGGPPVPPAGDSKARPGPFKMPASLANASYDELKDIWLEQFGTKMPAGMQGELAKKLLLPYLNHGQLADVLAEEAAIPVNMPDFTRQSYKDDRVRIKGGTAKEPTGDEED